MDIWIRKIRLWDPKCCRSRKKDCWIRKSDRTHETVQTHEKRLPVLKMLICSERISPADLNIRIIYRIFGSVRKDGRTRKKWIVGPRKLLVRKRKMLDPEMSDPWRELMRGSKYLNFKLVYGSAKRLLDPKVSDPQKEVADPNGKRVGARHCWALARIDWRI